MPPTGKPPLYQNKVVPMFLIVHHAMKILEEVDV
jgi:hypothetical protein